jgi:ferric-dicitrate binding protein FerR (iron transport regulator)
MTQLYDLLENLSQAAEDLPQLDKLATPPTPAWYRQPTAIAALLAGGIVLAAGVGLWVSRRDPPPPPSPPQEQLTAPEAAGDL